MTSSTSAENSSKRDNNANGNDKPSSPSPSTGSSSNKSKSQRQPIIVGKGLELVGDAPCPDGKRVKFIYQLYQILERRMCMDVVSWLPNGKTFAVFDKSKFETELMPLLLGSSAKFNSFVRRLLRWNFKQANDGSTCLFANPFFQSGCPRLLKQLRSKESKIGQLEQRLIAQQQMFGAAAVAAGTGVGRTSLYGGVPSTSSAYGGGMSAYGSAASGVLAPSSLMSHRSEPAADVEAARETLEKERRSALRRLQELDVLSSRLASISSADGGESAGNSNALVTPPSPPGFGTSYSAGLQSPSFRHHSSLGGGSSGFGSGAGSHSGATFSTNRNVKNILSNSNSLLNNANDLLSKGSRYGAGVGAGGMTDSMLDAGYPGSFTKSSFLGRAGAASDDAGDDSFSKMKLLENRRRHLDFMNTSNEARLIQQETIARLNKWMGTGGAGSLSPQAGGY